MKKYLNSVKGPLMSIAALAFVAFLIIPLPPFLIDLMIVLSFGISITVYMRANTIEEWDELKTFPTILLMTAIFRIALNVTTTRRILHDGNPGHVIEAAGNYIAGANIWIGLLVFIILIVVQFVVANGASRTAEVNARFTLEGMPMKQMSIDSQVNSSVITPEEAKDQRKKLEMEVDFYGNMDGAGKFIKGDVIIGLVLFVSNIVFGLIIGVMSQGMSLAEAATKFTILTIGDGLVNQISSLLLAVASGLVMTRVYGKEKENVTQGIFKELTSNSSVIYIVAGLFAFLGVFTKMPFIPFAAMSIAMIYLGYRKDKAKKAALKVIEENETQEPQEEKDRLEITGEVEPITLVLGIALVPIVAGIKGGESLESKIAIMRKTIFNDLGVVFPQIHIVDSSYLDAENYQIKIKDIIAGEGVIKTNRLLAFKTPYVVEEVEGEPTKDPLYGQEAIWISEDVSNQASENGYSVYDALTWLSVHLKEMVKKHVHELFTRQDARDMLDRVAEKHKVLNSEIDKEQIPLAAVQGVLQNMLREGISIKDLPTILEATIDAFKMIEGYDLSKAAGRYNKVDEMTAIVRERISKYICEKNKNGDGKMHLILLDKESELVPSVAARHDGYNFSLTMRQEKELVGSIIEQTQNAQRAEIIPVMFTERSDVRFAMARLLQKYNIPMSVISANELVSGIVVERLGNVKTSAAEQVG